MELQCPEAEYEKLKRDHRNRGWRIGNKQHCNLACASPEEQHVCQNSISLSNSYHNSFLVATGPPCEYGNVAVSLWVPYCYVLFGSGERNLSLLLFLSVFTVSSSVFNLLVCINVLPSFSRKGMMPHDSSLSPQLFLYYVQWYLVASGCN